MIFPISHERMAARRWPMVTTVLVAACVLVQAVLSIRGRGDDGSLDAARASAVEYFAEHPYLEVKPGRIPELDRATLQLAHSASTALDPPPDPETRATEQAELEARLAAATRVGAGDPIGRFGYVAAHPSVLALFTSQFVHTGWLQLAGNLWFLVFCGMTLEDRWGRVVFPLLYLAAGAVAALTHTFFFPHDAMPLVGASGAVAGCMGAFAVAFARTRVRFALLITLRPRTFTAPAYAVLPLWAAFEALWTWILPGDGTARLADVGGFAFGALAALLLHWTGVDRRLDDSVTRAAVLGGDPRIDEARHLVRQGGADVALAMLEGLAQEKPGSAHVQDAIAEAAHAVGDDAREQKALQRAQRLRATG